MAKTWQKHCKNMTKITANTRGKKDYYVLVMAVVMADVTVDKWVGKMAD